MPLTLTLDLQSLLAPTMTFVGLGSGFYMGRRYERVRKPPQALTMVSPAVANDGKAPRVAPPPPAPPHRWLIADSQQQPLLSISALDPARLRQPMRTVPLPGSGTTARLAAMLQAFPSMVAGIATQGAAEGGRLMRVQIDGAMIRAADGNGLRALAVDANGKFTEHARLFDVDKVQNVVNVAAIFQVVSVLVAQKHLADIDKRLKAIQSQLSGISEFLTGERRARITGTHQYLLQAHGAIRAGELSPSIRNELESCERDLAAIQSHLLDEYRQRAGRRAENSDRFGTGELAKNVDVKLNELDQIAHDLWLCMRTRVLAWHVLSLYPGEPALKEARAQQLRASIESIQDLPLIAQEQITRDKEQIKSLFNLESTLATRRQQVELQLEQHVQRVEQVRGGTHQEMQQSSQLLLAHDKPTQWVFEVRDGQLAGICVPA